MMRLASGIGLLLLGASGALALDNGLARTPPMGWNSWNKFGCKDINERVVRESADTMATNGMKDAGYEFIVIDDCWQVSPRAKQQSRQCPNSPVESEHEDRPR